MFICYKISEYAKIGKAWVLMRLKKEQELETDRLHKYNMVLFIILMLLIAFFLGGCKQYKEKQTNQDITPTVSITPEHTISTAPTDIPTSDITKLPEQSVTPTPEVSMITVEEAKQLIEDRIASKTYQVKLLSDKLEIDNIAYYEFIVSHGATAIEPLLLVEKTRGKILCYESDGTISADSTFPLFEGQKEIVIDWNGKFNRYNKLGEVTASIDLAQGDSNSFEFTINANEQRNTGKISGIATIMGNTALYKEESGFTLNFEMNENILSLSETGENTYTQGDITFDGQYCLEGTEIPMGTAISEEDAIKLLKALNKDQTGLPAEISKYNVKVDEMVVLVKNRVCYSLGVYAKIDDTMVLMDSFFVATDGSKIYKLNLSAKEDVEIYSIESKDTRNPHVSFTGNTATYS